MISLPLIGNILLLIIYVEHDLPLMGSSFSEYDYRSCRNQEGFMVMNLKKS